MLKLTKTIRVAGLIFLLVIPSSITANAARGPEAERVTLHAGYGSLRAWNYAGISWDFLASRHASMFVTGGIGTIFAGGGFALFTNRNGTGLNTAFTIGFLGGHINTGGQIKMGDYGFLTGGVGWGSYFTQHDGLMPFIGWEWRL
jgi:hypothetical protein